MNHAIAVSIWRLLPAVLLVLALGLVGCGGSTGSGGSGGGASSTGGGGEGDLADHDAGEHADADDGGDTPDADPVLPDSGALVGRWVGVSQDGFDLPEEELVFTYRADGTGVVVEGRNQRKDYTWVYDPEAGTLHILTENEDLNFNATLSGDTLTLVHVEPPMNLIMRRADDADDDE